MSLFAFHVRVAVEVEGALTVRLTATVCGVLVAPEAAMVMVPEYEPAESPEVFIVAVSVPEPVPDAGLRVSQAALSLAVQLKVPVPELVIVTV